MSILDKIYLGGVVNKEPHSQWQKEGKYLVGYHVEGCETFEPSGGVPLSMQSLRDDKLLYLCSNADEWFAKHELHMNEGNQVLYKVLFTFPSFELVFKSCDAFARYALQKANKTTSLPALVTLPEDNDLEELSESFLIHPTKWVVSIESLTVPQKVKGTDFHKTLLTEYTIIKQRNEEAVDLAISYGGIDGAHHKDWTIDQMVRKLTADDYDRVITEAKAGEDGPETYEWNTGIAP